jgi:CHAD domain-containing protein
MPAVQNSRRSVFQKFRRDLQKLASHPAPQRVHKFRTSSRRVEAQVTELLPRQGRNHKKLLKLLGKLRRKAGRVRDLDVQITSLRNLKIPEAAAQKRQLTRVLMEERAAQEKKLAAAFDKNCLRELRKRLKRAAADLKIQADVSLQRARELLAQLPADGSALTESGLHQHRIVGKRARYLAEVALPDPEAALLVKRLKRMQDGIGDWHDWWKLTQRAERLFSRAQPSPLVAALRNVTRAKFRQAVNALTEARNEMNSRPNLATAERKAASPQNEKMQVAAA